MFKKIALIVGVLALFAGTAIAQNPLTMELPDCDFTEYGGHVTATEDTLWFTTAMADAPAGFDGGVTETQDWFAPRVVPVGSLHDIIKTQFRVPRKVMLFAQAPFEVQPFFYGTGTFHRGGLSSAADASAGKAYVYVDSLAVVGGVGPASTRANKYPCQIMFSFVDSLHVVAAAGDSVKILVGY